MKKLIVLLFLLPFITNAATPTYCCGYECGIASAHWTLAGGSTPTFSTSTLRSGTRSLRFNPTAATSTATSIAIAAATNIWVVRAYVHFASMPTSSGPLFGLNVPGTHVGVYFSNSSGNQLALQTNNSPDGTPVNVSTGQWYRIEFEYHYSGGNRLLTGTVDGVSLGSIGSGLSDVTTTNLLFGFDGSNTADVYFDDVLVSNTTADYPFGAGHINHFTPTSDGTHNIAGTGDFQRTTTGTDILNATTTAYQLIDDIPLESGSSVDWINMVVPPNATDYVECLFGNAPGISTPTTAPRAVEVLAAIHQAGTGTGNMEINLNDNGTTNAVYTATTVAGSTTIVYKRKHYATAPTGGAWIITSGAGNFLNLKLRFESPAAVDANPDQYLDCTMIEAEFTDDVATVPGTPSDKRHTTLGVGLPEPQPKK